MGLKITIIFMTLNNIVQIVAQPHIQRIFSIMMIIKIRYVFYNKNVPIFHHTYTENNWVSMNHNVLNNVITNNYIYMKYIQINHMVINIVLIIQNVVNKLS